MERIFAKVLKIDPGCNRKTTVINARRKHNNSWLFSLSAYPAQAIISHFQQERTKKYIPPVF
jgi:hypothetical protein